MTKIIKQILSSVLVIYSGGAFATGSAIGSAAGMGAGLGGTGMGGSSVGAPLSGPPGGLADLPCAATRSCTSADISDFVTPGFTIPASGFNPPPAGFLSAP